MNTPNKPIKTSNQKMMPNEALKILKKLNGKEHHLISSVCISKNGSMVWNHTDKASLTMKKMTDQELKNYLVKLNFPQKRFH